MEVTTESLPRNACQEDESRDVPCRFKLLTIQRVRSLGPYIPKDHAGWFNLERLECKVVPRVLTSIGRAVSSQVPSHPSVLGDSWPRHR